MICFFVLSWSVLCFPNDACTTTRIFDLVHYIGSVENWSSVCGRSKVANLGGFCEDFDFDIFVGI